MITINEILEYSNTITTDHILTAGTIATLLFLYKHKGKSVKKSHLKKRECAYKVLKKVNSLKNSGQVITYLRKIDPFVFEEVILNVLDKRKDISITRNEKYTGDGGIDGRFTKYLNSGLKRNPHEYIIQAKRYKSYINPSHIIDFQNKIDDDKIAKYGLFVHTGKTGRKAMEAIRHCDKVLLISGEKLAEFFKNGIYERIANENNHYVGH